MLKCIDNLKVPFDLRKRLISLFADRLARIYLIGTIQQTANHLKGKLSLLGDIV